MRKQEIRRLVLAALFASMAVILKTYLSVQVSQDMRISFTPIPLLIAGYFLGPVYGFMSALAADLTYSFLSPFPYMFTFTISTVIWGIAGALIRKFTIKKSNIIAYIIIIAITSILETSLNTLGNYLLDLDIYAKLLSRIITMFVRIPILVILTKSLVRALTNLEVLDYHK